MDGGEGTCINERLKREREGREGKKQERGARRKAQHTPKDALFACLLFLQVGVSETKCICF